MSSSRVSPWFKAVVGTVALGLALTGCGGTRESDAAIQTAAGVGAAPATAAADAGGAGTTAAAAPAPVAAAPAAVPDATSANSAAAPAAGAPVASTAKKSGAASTAAAITATATGSAGKAAAVKKTEAAASPAAPAAAKAAGPVTKKSLIKLGVVGTFSGPVGGLVKDTVTGIRAWAESVNAAGGLNGHPVQILVGDDGGDPARYNSILQQFVEQQGVLAFLYTTLGFAPNGNNKYLDAKKMYTFATEGGLEVPYQDPYVLTPAPSGLTYADVMVLSFGNGIGAKGGVKLASFACSDFGLCDNFDKRWSDKSVLDKAGFTLVARGRPSLTQPDYTSQCLAAKQAGATAIIMALDGAAIRRFAGDCARQNYHPKLSSADLVITKDLPGDKNVDGLIIGTKMAPFPDSRVPGIKNALDAFSRFAPGQTPTGGMSYGYLIGQFFAEAGKDLPDNPTQTDLANGLYSIKNDNMEGMTYPITMTRGKPMARQLCYGTAEVSGDKFAVAPGKAFNCANGGKPMSNPDDYASVTGGSGSSSTQGAAMRSALLRQPARPEHPVVVPARFTAYTAAPADACPPARAAGFSYLLDAFQTGSSAGPGVFYGIALAALGTPLPAPFGAYQQQFLAASGTSVEKFSKDAPAAIQALRSYFAPFAVYNDYGNGFIDAGAKAVDGFSDNYGSFIQPGDTTLHQFASSMRDAKATQSPCAVVVKDSGNATVNALANALANGRTDQAKALIAQHHLATDVDTLGQAVYYAGIAAADAHSYDPFIKATSESFVDGGVSPLDTGRAFQAAAAKATQQGLTMEQGAIGFRTICATYQRYLTEGKLS